MASEVSARLAGSVFLDCDIMLEKESQEEARAKINPTEPCLQQPRSSKLLKYFL